jgi:hypothetical protein
MGVGVGVGVGVILLHPTHTHPLPSLHVHDFVLLFLPPCGPNLTPLATGSLKPSLLVSPLLGGPARHRPFVLALHLHQRKSNCNLHLQYLAKSQSTPRCQSPITARSDHPPVLGCSSPQTGMVWRRELGGGSCARRIGTLHRCVRPC